MNKNQIKERIKAEMRKHEPRGLDWIDLAASKIKKEMKDEKRSEADLLGRDLQTSLILEFRKYNDPNEAVDDLHIPENEAEGIIKAKVNEVIKDFKEGNLDYFTMAEEEE